MSWDGKHALMPVGLADDKPSATPPPTAVNTPESQLTGLYMVDLVHHKAKKFLPLPADNRKAFWWGKNLVVPVTQTVGAAKKPQFDPATGKTTIFGGGGRIRFLRPDLYDVTGKKLLPLPVAGDMIVCDEGGNAFVATAIRRPSMSPWGSKTS